MSAVVADTSVWIDYFAGVSVPTLDQALSIPSVVVPPIVIAELLSGAGNARERRELRELLSELPIHPTPFEHWVRVGELRLRLRNRGFSISIPDAHVAQCALDEDGLLLSRDAIFGKISRTAGLRVASE